MYPLFVGIAFQFTTGPRTPIVEFGETIETNTAAQSALINFYESTLTECNEIVRDGYRRFSGFL